MATLPGLGDGLTLRFVQGNLVLWGVALLHPGKDRWSVMDKDLTRVHLMGFRHVPSGLWVPGSMVYPVSGSTYDIASRGLFILSPVSCLCPHRAGDTLSGTIKYAIIYHITIVVISITYNQTEDSTGEFISFTSGFSQCSDQSTPAARFPPHLRPRDASPRGG